MLERGSRVGTGEWGLTCAGVSLEGDVGVSSWTGRGRVGDLVLHVWKLPAQGHGASKEQCGVDTLRCKWEGKRWGFRASRGQVPGVLGGNSY